MLYIAKYKDLAFIINFTIITNLYIMNTQLRHMTAYSIALVVVAFYHTLYNVIKDSNL